MYGDAQGFNYDPDTLSSIISEFCEDFYKGADEPDTNTIWEVDKGQFRDMTRALARMPEEEFDERMSGDWFGGYGEPYTKEEVVSLFKAWLKETSRKSGYVCIGWL